jgi:hypothetical protein
MRMLSTTWNADSRTTVLDRLRVGREVAAHRFVDVNASTSIFVAVGLRTRAWEPVQLERELQR